MKLKYQQHCNQACDTNTLLFREPKVILCMSKNYKIAELFLWCGNS